MSATKEIEMTVLNDGSKSPISFKYLRKFNLIMGIVHFVQATFMLIFGLTNASFKGFNVPLDILKVDYPINTLDGFFTLSNVGPIIASFLYFSAVAHLLVAGPLYGFYQKKLKAKMNPIRWFEYAFSSSGSYYLFSQ